MEREADGNDTPNAARVFDGPGEMRARCRALDWAATPLGPVAHWPTALRATAQLVLAHPFPTIVLWGSALVQLYNDGCRALMGVKHPAGLGQPTRECWPEAWHLDAPIYDRVWRGESVALEDARFPIARSGALEDAWFTLAYSPAYDDTGAVGGVFLTIHETTARRHAEAALRESESRQAFLLGLSDALRPLADPPAIIATASEMVGRHLDAGRCGYGELPPPHDHFVVERDWTNGMPSHRGRWRLADFGDALVSQNRAGRTLVIEDAFADARGEGAEAAIAAAGGLRASIGVPLVKDGNWVAAFFVHDARPRRWSAADIALVEDVAERTWAAVERARADAATAASEAKYRTLFESMDEGFAIAEVVYDDDGRPWDLRHLEVNPAFERHSGYADVVGRTVREIIPYLEDAWVAAYARVVATGESLRFEQYNGGVDKWFNVYLSRLGGEESRLLTIVFTDVTERKRAEAVLREREERQAFLLKLSDALRPLADPLDVQAAACRVLGEHLGANRVLYAETSEGAGAPALVRAVDYTHGVPSRVGWHRLDDYGPWVTETWRAGRNLLWSSLDDVPHLSADERAAYEAVEIEAIIGVPLVKDGRFIAFLAVHQATPRTWTPLEIALVEETVERTWAAVERARAEASLLASEARYRTLVDNLRDHAVVLLDAEGRVTEWTASAERVTGYRADEAVGREAAHFYATEDVAAGVPARHLAQAASEGHGEWEGWRARRDGSRFWANEIMTALHDADGRVVGFTKISRDLTGRRLSEEAAEHAHRAAARDELRRALAAAEEAERRRLARELHDQLGQELTAFRLGLDDALRLATDGTTRDDAPLRSRLVELQALASRMTAGARYLALELRPPELDDLGFESALETYVREWSARYGVAADLAVTGLRGRAIPPDVTSALYRIVQEALTNVAKHARASQVSLVVDRPDGEVRLLVEDDGRGFDPEATGARVRAERRLGLAGMRERAALVGGTVVVESSPGVGTTVYARLPVDGRVHPLDGGGTPD